MRRKGFRCSSARRPSDGLPLGGSPRFRTEVGELVVDLGFVPEVDGAPEAALGDRAGIGVGFNWIPQFLEALRQVGVDRMMFSTDHPCQSMTEATAFLARHRPATGAQKPRRRFLARRNRRIALRHGPSRRRRRTRGSGEVRGTARGPSGSHGVGHQLISEPDACRPPGNA